MSSSKVYAIHCDAAGCHATHFGRTGPIDRTRAEARNSGWSHERGGHGGTGPGHPPRDLCPAHNGSLPL